LPGLIKKKMSKEINIKDYMKQQVKDGYILENGTPLKCHYCENEKLKDNITDQSEQGIMEYEKVCSDCDTIVGCWSYGHWQL